MSTYTNNLNLIKPDYDDDIDVAQLNNNSDVIDTQITNIINVNDTQNTHISKLDERVTKLENKVYPDLPLTYGNLTSDYYEAVDCAPTQEELNAVEKQQLLQQVKTVNDQITELDVAVMCDNGDDTTDIIVDGNVLTMTSDELDAYHTEVMNLRSDILNRIKELK